MRNDFKDITYGGLVAIIIISLLVIVLMVISFLMWYDVNVIEWIFSQL